MRLYGPSHGKVDFFSIVTAPGLCALTTRADGRARYEAETYETTPGLLKSMGREPGQAEVATLTRKKGRVRQVSERAGSNKRRVTELSGI